MKADAQRAKAAALLGEDYKPAVPGVGAAWCAIILTVASMMAHQAFAQSQRLLTALQQRLQLHGRLSCPMLTLQHLLQVAQLSESEAMASPEFPQPDEGL